VSEVSPSARASPVLALVELRALLAWRRLRGSRGTAEGVAVLVLFLLAVPGSIAAAVLVGVGSWRAAQTGVGLQASITIGALFFGVWQTWTAVSLSLGDRDILDLRRFILYPIAPRRIWSIGLVGAAVADPFTLFWIALLGGAFVGAALGRPGAWLIPLGASLVAFAAGTAALVALIQEIGGRFARSRWFREVVIVAGLVGWAALLVTTGFAAESPRALAEIFKRLRWVAYPPALAVEAVRPLYAGRPAEAWPWIALLAGSAWLTALAAYRLALAGARSGGEGGVVSPGRSAVSPGLLGRLVGPLVEKELRYLARNPAVRVYSIVLPAVTAIVAWHLARDPIAGAPELSAALPVLVIAAYVHLVSQAFWLNAFGWEHGGARALFLAPISAETVLRARNRALGMSSALLFLVAAAAAVSVAGWPPGWAVLGAVALHLGLAPAVHGAGNVVSILNPRAVALRARRGAPIPPLSSLGGLAIVSGASGIFGAPVLLAVWTGSPWVMAPCWAALALATYVTYRLTLPRVAALLERRREEVLAAVTGDDL
jgi:ABC-2 type transport system permease protein